MQVQIDSSRPVYMTVDAAEFGKLFAKMSSEEQVAVLQEVVDAMRPWNTQWDYIAIELAKPEHVELRRNLRNIIRDMELPE